MHLSIELTILSILSLFLARLPVVSAQQTTVRNISVQGPDGPQQQFATVPYSFTLVALNNTLPNANLTGAPLVLGQAGATGGAYLYITSTYASFPYNDHPTLGLSNGTLKAFDKSGRWYTNATSVANNQQMTWLQSIMYHVSDEARMFSIITGDANGTFPFPLLAARGYAHLWSLCPAVPGRGGQVNVVFNATVPTAGMDVWGGGYREFDSAGCYGVELQVLALPSVI